MHSEGSKDISTTDYSTVLISTAFNNKLLHKTFVFTFGLLFIISCLSLVQLSPTSI